MSCQALKDGRNSQPLNSPRTLKKPLIGQSEADLETICDSFKEPLFRTKQLFSWLYKSKVNSFREMRNFPIELRNKFEKEFCIHPLEFVHVTGSTAESTRKFLFRLQTSELVESVLIKEGNRTTICVSSQVGCAADCQFCATASMGFQKNLNVGEIVDQFLQVGSSAQTPISNVVFMGMGEPFLNYKNVIAAANLLNNKNGIKLGARRITISTVGIIPKIIRFSDEKHRYKLAVSLNGSSQKIRFKTMPIAEKYPLTELLTATDYYTTKSGQPVTFEYVLMDKITDGIDNARKLINMLNGRRCKLNVIPYNEIGGKYKRPSENGIKSFLEALQNTRFPVMTRWSKGTDIHAGCGQLAVLEKPAK